MALYDATGGNSWTDSTNWGTDEPLDRWHGVRTDDAGRVVELDLYVNNLTGSIPPELGALINLTRLEAANNKLTGPLPLSMTNLRRLSNLDIENSAGLCASADAAFQEWLATVNTFTGDTCADGVEPTAPDEDPQERAALMALYDATNGNNWTNSTNWGTDEPVGHWHGVRTDGVGRVLLLELQENNLTGPIPPRTGSPVQLAHAGSPQQQPDGVDPAGVGRLDQPRSPMGCPQ